MNRRQLILVKHALPDIKPDVPADEWHLSAEGKTRSMRLAERLTQFQLATLVSSPEPKAVETARIVAERLELEVRIAAALHEHRRSKAGLYDQAQFESQVEQFFATPSRLVFGEETADSAHTRFANAVESIVTSRLKGNIGIIAHGTVITLFVSRVCALDPFSLWKRLGLPSYIVLNLPGYRLSAVVEQV